MDGFTQNFFISHVKLCLNKVELFLFKFFYHYENSSFHVRFSKLFFSLELGKVFKQNMSLAKDAVVENLGENYWEI